jgi:Protein of unknown function (DUF2971)
LARPRNGTRKDTETAATAVKGPQRPLDLSTLNEFLLFISSDSYAEDFNRAGDRALFHYTDLSGLRGIVIDDDLWLTNSRFSNDDKEMTFGYAIAKGVLDQELAEPGKDREFLEEVRRLLDSSTPEGVYICCFCARDNLLSQWRGYGANGTGVSVEIDAKEFSWATGPDMPLGLMRLWKVYYHRPRQEDMVRKAISFGRTQLRHIDLQDRARMTADVIEFFIPTFKDADFSEEDEWRLIFTPASACRVMPQFRVARQMLVPYYRFRELLNEARANGLERLPIRKVMIGPNPQSSLNKESVKMLLAAKYPTVQVEASPTSYRGN